MSQHATGRRAIRPDWLSKTLAGLLLGLGLGLAVSALLSQGLGALPLGLRGQLAMWSVAPVWLATQSLVYLFASGRRAWLALGTLNLLAWGAWVVWKGLAAASGV